MKRYLKLLALGLGLSLLLVVSGCNDVKKRADTVDTWQQIKQKKRVVIGLDDSFVPMGFRQKDGKLVGYDIDLGYHLMDYD